MNALGMEYRSAVSSMDATTGEIKISIVELELEAVHRITHGSRRKMRLRRWLPVN
jgi:hypothetical protein